MMIARIFSKTQTAPDCALPLGGRMMCVVTIIGTILAGGPAPGEAQTLVPGTDNNPPTAPIINPVTGATMTATANTEPVAGTPSEVLPVQPRTNVGLPGTMPTAIGRVRESALPRVFAPSRPRRAYTRYPWKLNIVTTVFWIGERPTVNNPTPNHMSSWDREWAINFGGYDDPDPSNRTDNYHPKGFVPGQNPFYIALPYNDVQSGTYRTKVEARQIIPWFHREFKQHGHTVLKGRWIAIRRAGKVCYGQWEDVGPFETDDWRYVFGDSRPRTTGNGGAGLDVSPAIRDYLDFNSGHAVVDWRFVDVQEVPDGPWKHFGANNDFVQLREAARDAEQQARYEEMELLKAKRAEQVN